MDPAYKWLPFRASGRPTRHFDPWRFRPCRGCSAYPIWLYGGLGRNSSGIPKHIKGESGPTIRETFSGRRFGEMSSPPGNRPFPFRSLLSPRPLRALLLGLRLWRPPV
jgi:hypothetical protein